VGRGAQRLSRRAVYSFSFALIACSVRQFLLGFHLGLGVCWVSPVAAAVGASSGVWHKRLLSLHLGEEMLLGEFCSSFAGCVRLVCPFPFAVGRDRLPHPGGSFVAVVSEVLSSWRMAAPDRCFPCLRQSGSGQFLFSDSSASWRARGVDS
jgi:hypothetical protein